MTRPAEDTHVLTISQLTRRIKGLLEDEVGTVWVGGEVSNWRVSPAGHAYFTLKDASSQIDAVMFRGRLSRLRFNPENGLDVVVSGLVTVYERRGNYQIICEEMQPKGLGALQLAFEKLKRKLQEEGLFDEAHKKPIPRFPRRIGVVTSPTGAAIRDILNVLGRRFANVHVLLYPARVQGDEAAPEIVAGIQALDAYGVDVIIVGRGGGSLEDLWPFNEEQVVRAIFGAKTPVISAVGHEIDFALSDFAADLRAPTPSAAAELVVRERQHLLDGLAQSRARMVRATTNRIEEARQRVQRLAGSYVFRRPEELVRQRRQQTDELRLRMHNVMTARLTALRARADKTGRGLALLSPSAQVRRALERMTELRRRLLQAGVNGVDRARSKLRTVMAQLDALSPLAILSRGYALAWTLPGRALVRGIDQLAPGQVFELQVCDGRAAARVEKVAPADSQDAQRKPDKD